MFTVAQSHFWKKQKTKNKSVLDLCPAFLIKVWVRASPCLRNLHCTARQHLLVEAQCVPCCSFAVSRTHVQQTLPTKDTHSHTNTPPISIYQANLLCSSQNKTSLARLEEEGRFCIHPDMLRNAHLFLPAAALLLWSTNTAYGKPYRKAGFWSFTAQCRHLLWRFVNERDQEACWLSSLKVTAGYISISLNLSYRLGTPLQPVLLQPSNEIMN